MRPLTLHGQSVERWQGEQREREGRQQTSDDHCCQESLDVRANAVRCGSGDHAEAPIGTAAPATISSLKRVDQARSGRHTNWSSTTMTPTKLSG